MKNLIINFFVILLLIHVVYGSAGFVETSITISGKQGETITGNFKVNNTANETLKLEFSQLTLTKGSDTLQANSIPDLSIKNLSIETIVFSVAIPSGHSTGFYTGTLNLKNKSSGDTLDNLQVNLEVMPSVSINVSPSLIFLGDAIRNSTRSATFTLANTGNGNITNILLKGNVAEKYNLQINKSQPFNLITGEKEIVLITLTIPNDEQTSNHSIGTLLLNSKELNATLSNIDIDVRGGLAITDLDIKLTYLDGETEFHNDVNNGDTLKFEDNIRPGSELQFEISLENTFTDKEDIDINDINTVVIIKEIDDEEDIDQESKEIDLKPQDEETLILILKIPLEVEEGIYDVLIEVEGEDDEGTAHRVDWVLELKLDKERRKVIIRNAELSKKELICDRQTRLNIGVLNIGSLQEQDLKITAFNKDIGLDFVQENVDLDSTPFESDDLFEKIIPISVDKNISAGTYPITVNIYLSSTALFDTKTVDLVVKDCSNGKTAYEQKVEETKKESKYEPEINEEGNVNLEKSTEEETSVFGAGEKIQILTEEFIEPQRQFSASQFVIISIIIMAVGIGSIFLVVKLATKVKRN